MSAKVGTTNQALTVPDFTAAAIAPSVQAVFQQPASKQVWQYGVILLALLLAGCQQLPPAPYASEQRIDVPFFPQTDYHCGPAALASMLHWGGAEADLDSLIDEVWLPGRRGSLAIELDAAARTRGLLVYPLQHPDHLWAELDAGHPVLVLQNLGSTRWPRWHFAVVIGYRNDGQRILLHTDTRPSHSSHWSRFIRTWARADFSGFVMLPEGKLPAISEPLALATALDALEHSTTQPAVERWQQATLTHPDAALLQLGLGNAHYAHEAYDKAVTAFLAAIEQNPQLAPAWNNLADALGQLGCIESGQRAIAEALRQRPEHPVFLSTRAMLDNLTQDIGGTQQCPSAEAINPMAHIP